MKIKFKHQKFQADAAKAVCDVFAGQPNLSASYMIDKGIFRSNIDENDLYYEEELKRQKTPLVGFKNHGIVTRLDNTAILNNLQKIQRLYQIEPSAQLEGNYNLTVEMETGVGKTYTYIKTMYELYNHYGWTKFIIVVPSIAIREGVFASLKSTQEHFAEEYNKKIKFFIYNSTRLNEIEQFANDGGINVMIINSQAFNARGKDARRIYMKLDSFRSRKPIDVLAATNPILIIDEPQSVEGKVTKEKLKEFNPLMTLRYSATPKELYNCIYRLDAIEAYNKKLVKKIAVKSVTISGSDATNGYVYLQGINIAKDKNPTATVEFDYKGQKGISKSTRVLVQGDNLFDKSNELDEYKDGYTISTIDGRDDSITFVNGIKIYAGDVTGEINEEQIRRLQIRETIRTHLTRERELFYKGIKVLSLFFIDEVAKYKKYDADNNELNGVYAEIFEEEYKNIFHSFQIKFGEDEYIRHIDKFTANNTHAGYFSIDKKSKKIIDSKEDKKEGGSTDSDAYDLIMKNKEQLLSFAEPVRFIFSHSALREGWDNPNVFQICTLKKSAKEDKKRQEIGRGLRLCVNQHGERMDSAKLGETVHDTNVLTVIANESYKKFSDELQKEIAEVSADRPIIVDVKLFENKVIVNENGTEQIIDTNLARKINNSLVRNSYVDDDGKLTDKYYDDKQNGQLVVPDEVKGYEHAIINILDRIYNPKSFEIENANASKVTLEFNRDNLEKKEFKALWKRINAKSAYVVKFETNELIQKAIKAINNYLNVTQLFAVIEEGSMEKIESKKSLEDATSFKNATKQRASITNTNYEIKYDLIGKIVAETNLTRKSVVEILTGIDKYVFAQFKINPEDFIIKVSNLINEEKATAIIEHITYNKLEEAYDIDIFTEPTLKQISTKNSIESQKGLYSHVIYDSSTEKVFSEELDANREVSVYVKLPRGFYINTPVGKYNPDWAIAFEENSVKHIYFVAETKGSMQSMQLKQIEQAKINCAKVHFAAISSDTIKYDVIDNYQSLLNKVMS